MSRPDHGRVVAGSAKATGGDMARAQDMYAMACALEGVSPQEWHYIIRGMSAFVLEGHRYGHYYGRCAVCLKPRVALICGLAAWCEVCTTAHTDAQVDRRLRNW